MNEDEKRAFSRAPSGTADGLDAIDAMLRSVGLSPLERSGTGTDAEKTRNFTPAKPDVSEDGKTKNFTLKSEPLPLAHKAPPKTPTAAAEENEQLLLDGYADEEAPRRVNEAEVETQLQRNRKNLVERFRVFSTEEEDNAILEKDAAGEGATSVFDALELKEGEGVFDAVARADKQEEENRSVFTRRLSWPRREQRERTVRKRTAMLDVKTAREKLAKQREQVKRTALLQLAFFAAATLLALLATIYESNGALSLLYGHGARVFTLLNLGLMAASAMLAKGVVKTAIEHVKVQTLSPQVVQTALAALAVLHGLLSLVVPLRAQTGIVSFAPCMIFSFFLRDAVAYVQTISARNDLSVMTRAKQLQGLLMMEAGADADEIGHGITEKMNPQILYAADVALPQKYDGAQPSDSRLQDLILRYGSPAALAVALVFAVVMSAVQKSAVYFFPTLVSCAFLLIPLTGDAVSLLLKLRSDALLSLRGAVVPSAQAASAVGTADAVILDSDAVFEARVTRFKPVPGGRMQAQDAALYAAATLHGTRSLIAKEFDRFLADANMIVPDAEDLQYEDKLGYACWIAGRRVLVGNREMLVQHSIPAPSAAEEQAYGKNRCVLYVAVEGLVAATFLVQYTVRREVKNCVKLFNKAGLVLMLNSGDPSLTEEYAAKKLAVDVAAIKIMNAKCVGIVQSHKNAATQKTASLLCAKEQNATLQLIYAAHNLFEAQRLSEFLCVAGLAICLLILILCVALKVSTFFFPLTVVFLQLIWSLVSYFSGATRLK